MEKTTKDSLMKLIFALLLLTLSLLGHAKAKYYYGDVKYLGADGISDMGGTVSLIERTMDLEAGIIIERALSPDKPGEKPSLYVTHIERLKGLSFKTYDDGKTFSGTMNYKNPALTEWTYDLQVQGGLLKGTGILSEKGIETDKSFQKKNGEVVMKIRDHLKEITEKQYKKLKKEMSSGK